MGKIPTTAIGRRVNEAIQVLRRRANKAMKVLGDMAKAADEG